MCFEYHPAKGLHCPGYADGSCPYRHYDTKTKEGMAQYKEAYARVPERFRARLPAL